MPSPLEQRVEALERQLADMQAMLESLLDYVQRQSRAAGTSEAPAATEARHE